MAIDVHAEKPPIREDESGALRVGGTRVLLELVVWAHDSGSTPEEIVEMYPSLPLADVYGVIAFYLRNKAVVDAYIAERERIGEEYRQKSILLNGDQSALKARLEARLEVHRRSAK